MNELRNFVLADLLKQAPRSWVILPLIGPLILHLLLLFAFTNFGDDTFGVDTYNTISRGLWGLLVCPFTIFVMVQNTFSVEANKRTFEYLYTIPHQRKMMVPGKFIVLSAQLWLSFLAYLICWSLPLLLLAHPDSFVFVDQFTGQVNAILRSALAFEAILLLHIVLSFYFAKTIYVIGIGLVGIVISYAFINLQALEKWPYTLPLHNLQNDVTFGYTLLLPLLLLGFFMVLGVLQTQKSEHYEF